MTARKCVAPIRYFIVHKYCGMKINIQIGTIMKRMTPTSGISGKKTICEEDITHIYREL